MKSKIKQNPYQRLIIAEIQSIEEQERYLLKHPKEASLWCINFALSLNPSIDTLERMRIMHELEKDK